MARTKSLGANLPVPQDDGEAREAIRELGVTNRKVMRIEADLNDRIAKLKDDYAAKAAPLRERATALHEGLRMFAEANRDRLTDGGKRKHAVFATGEIAWRFRPASVKLRQVASVIEAIKAAGLGATFLRVKEEVNKEAMLAAREDAMGIPGVTIGSDGEDFIVEPDEEALDEVTS